MKHIAGPGCCPTELAKADSKFTAPAKQSCRCYVNKSSGSYNQLEKFLSNKEALEKEVAEYKKDKKGYECNLSKIAKSLRT